MCAQTYSSNHIFNFLLPLKTPVMPTKSLISGLSLGLKTILFLLTKAIIPLLYPTAAHMDKDNFGWQLSSSSKTIKLTSEKKLDLLGLGL